MDPLEIELEGKLRRGYGEGESSRMTIFRVPSHVRDANKELYEPRLVSIGPYYRGRDALRAMEQHKWRYLRELWEGGDSLAKYVGVVRNVEQQARCCYSERTDIFDAVADEFAMLLLLDGLFILQFFIKWHNSVPDKLCDVGWMLVLLHHDLLLLENQIPFFVLEELFRVAFPCTLISDLRRLILPHLRLDYFTFQLSADVITPKIDHLLHLFYEAFLPSSLQQQLQERVTRDTGVARGTQHEAQPSRLAVPSVTMLREAGVWFKEKKSPKNMFDITFDKAKGIMSMPHIVVDQANMPLLVNLVAFEQTRGLIDTFLPLSSYSALMSFLVKIGKDVEQLQKRGIIDNLLSSNDDAAANFFQQQGACSSLDYKKHLFATMFADLNQYYKSRCHKQKENFRREYCSSAWRIMAIVVGIILFLFAAFKTVTSIYNLVHPIHT